MSCLDCNDTSLPLGPTGPTGLQGIPGINGTNGTNGDDGPAGPDTLINLIYVDQVYGDDDTGTKYRITTKYKTILAAETAAISGDTIYIFPGAYTDINLGKDGVGYHFCNGANLISTGNNFRDNGVAKTFKITGYGDFSATLAFLLLTSAGSIVNFQVNNITNIGTVDDNAAINVTGLVTGVILNNLIATVNAGLRGIQVITGGKVYIQANKIITIGEGISTDATSSTTTEVYIEANEIRSTGATGSNYPVKNDGGYMNIKANLINEGANAPCLGMVGSGGTNARVDFEGNMLSTGNNAVELVNVSVGVTSNLFIRRGLGEGRITVEGGSHYIEGNIDTGLTSNSSIVITGGTLIFKGRIKNNSNNALAHGVLKSGGTLILDDATIITTHTSSESLSSATPQDVIIYLARANKAKNANITELVLTMTVDALVQ